MTILSDLADKFSRETAAIFQDYDGFDYLSIPAGFAQAIEVERDRSVRTTLSWLVLYRAWDRTHGLSEERLLVQIHEEHLLEPVIRAIVEKLYADAEAEWERTEALYREIGD